MRISDWSSDVCSSDLTTFNFANRDLPVPPSPCQLMGPAQPLVYDTSAWLIYTCTDNTVIARRFFHPIDNVRPPVTPSTVAVPLPSACPGSFVAGKYGG